MNSAQELVTWLESQPRQIDLRDLQLRLDDERLTSAALSDYIHFSEQHYSRNLLAHGPQFYALVMCWLPGQAVRARGGRRVHAFLQRVHAFVGCSKNGARLSFRRSA